MPDDRDPQRNRRPDYFTAFDGWLQQLEAHIADPITRAAVLTTLDEDGRQVDLQQLAAQRRLTEAAVRLIRRLVRFGDVGHPVHSFGSTCIAEITPRMRSPSVITYVYATRRGAQVEYWWADTADGFGVLGVRGRPLTVREAEAMVRRVIAAQASYDVIDGGDRSAYAPDRASMLRIRSAFYPRLDAGVRRRTSPRTGRRW